MATPARKLAEQVVHCIRRRVTFADTNSATVGLEVGVIPAGSFVQAITVNIETAFNAATTNVLTVGTTATVGGLATNAGTVAGTPGMKTALTGTLSGNTATDMQVMVFYSQTGTAATAGVADVLVTYYPFAN